VESQEDLILRLKAELYDVNKEFGNAQQLIAAVASLVGADPSKGYQGIYDTIKERYPSEDLEE
jgi:hypothetical protein